MSATILRARSARLRETPVSEGPHVPASTTVHDDARQNVGTGPGRPAPTRHRSAALVLFVTHRRFVAVAVLRADAPVPAMGDQVDPVDPGESYPGYERAALCVMR